MSDFSSSLQKATLMAWDVKSVVKPKTTAIHTHLFTTLFPPHFWNSHNIHFVFSHFFLKIFHLPCLQKIPHISCSNPRSPFLLLWLHGVSFPSIFPRTSEWGNDLRPEFFTVERVIMPSLLLLQGFIGVVASRCFPHPTLFSIWTYLKRSEKIPGAPARMWGEWIWLTGPYGLYRNSLQGLNISSIRVFD